MAISLPSFNNFAVHEDPTTVGPRWAKWKSRFEVMLTGLDITAEKRKQALLLYYAGEEVQDIYDTIKVADEPKETLYTRTTTALDTYFAPKANTEFNVYQFRQMKQTSGESLDTFHTRLQQAAAHCGYADKSKEIKTQIIQNCVSNKLRRRALRESDLSLTDLLKAGRAMELAEQQAQDIEKMTSEVQRVRMKSPRRHSSSKSHKKSPEKKPFNTKQKPRSSKPCYFCGGSYPHKSDCPAKGKTCNSCGKLNHFESVCHTKKRFVKQITETSPRDDVRSRDNPQKENASQHSDSDDSYVFTINTASTETLPRRNLMINGTRVKFLIDSGASSNLLSRKHYDRLEIQPPITKSNQNLLAYNKEPIPTMGTIKVNIATPKKKIEAEFFIVDKDAETLIGYKSASNLGIIEIPEINIVKDGQSQKEAITANYPDLFSGVGKLHNYKVKLHIDENVTPQAQPHRRIPFHKRKLVEKELDRLEQLDIIEKTEGPTPWVSPIVAVNKPKSPDKIRLCVDMRAPNRAIKRERHVTPTVDDIITSLNGATCFSKLDLNSGYHQLELHPDSRYITTFSTHAGLYRYKRLNFGVSSAAEIFQETIRDTLHGIPGQINVSDDILVFGTSKDEHDKALQAVLRRLRERGITLNSAKCEFSQPKLEFYGHKFTSSGVSPDPKKVQFIKEATRPESPQEVASLLGLANYCSRFIPNLATIVQPLRKLTHKDTTWSWGDDQDHALRDLKNALCESTSTAYYDTAKKTKLLVDASPVGLGAVLTQEDKIVAFASKTLNATEQRYSQIEREALAITWACRHFKLYLLGDHFIVVTDHKPLLPLFNNPKSTPPARIENWILKLQNYNFTVEYCKGALNPADYFSRYTKSSDCDDTVSASAEEYVNLIVNFALPKTITLEDIKYHYKDDKEMCTLAEIITTNRWHESHLDKYKDVISLYGRFKDELCVVSENNIILRGSRIVIPRALREKTLDIAHAGHQGIVRTKSLLREKVWFPNIDKMTETKIKNCLACLSATTEPKQRDPLQMTPLPSGPWQEVSVDFCDIDGQELLVVIDDYSRFPEIELVSTTSAKAVIPKLDKIFSSYGVPVVVRTDNGPPFNSADFENFANYLGFKHRKITPRWPEANGEVERFMRTLRKLSRTSTSWKQDLYSFLRNYRATPHSTTGMPPATALFGRPVRTRLPEIQTKPTNLKSMKSTDERRKAKMKSYADKRRHVKPTSVSVGDQVLVKQDIKKKSDTPYKKVPYKVIQKKGTMITAERDNHRITRNASHFKRIPSPLNRQNCPSDDSEDELDDLNLQRAAAAPAHPPQDPPEVIRQPVLRAERPRRERKTPGHLKDFVV